VLRAFGGTQTAIPLARDTWRAGDVVVKRVLEAEEAAWCQRVLAGLAEEGFRRPAPIAADGEWVVDGWTGCVYVEDLTDGQGRLRDVLAASDRFHDALPPPDAEARAVLGRRVHRWAIADRVAWGEATLELRPAVATLLGRILGNGEPDSDFARVVHGDLEGNVSFDDDGVAVVLDFSPYIRSRRYARAIAVVDAMLWRGGGPELIELVGARDGRDLLARRALAFRFVAEELGGGVDAHALASFERVLEQVEVSARGAPSG
jgi:uncharacterized protein (TIGR02569 family)